MAKAKLVVELNEGSVDRLGVLLAQIADLTKEADAIKDAIKLSGQSIEGNLFKATLVDMDRKVFDKEFFVAQNGAEVYDAYTKNTLCISVRVTSR
ncbi:hypothetical protein UFOVP125_37 [uncultured Caudovirales phage]|uniref:Uncharacterized protein n=1 Tax=uncultured Caudovirales phage TaxID=2100421 RepID=A0A6J5LFH1_9CAUD|nr:hypothetical protein UFOVP125_37 [uncultured Caudovirales phage]